MVARVLVIAALLAAGCEKRSTKYCGLHREDLANCEQTDAATPDPVACSTTIPCTIGYCELVANVCVECLDNAHCDNGERCDIGGSYKCRGCISDTDCPGGACLPGGSCGDDATVVFVTAGGSDSGTCAAAAPCGTLAYGLMQVDAARRYLRITGTHSDNLKIVTDVEIIGYGARYEASANGVVLDVDGAVVKIYGMTIACDGDQDGVQTGGGATLTLDGVDISGCDHEAGIDIHGGFAIIARSHIHDNPAGGIRTDGAADFSITNNFIHHNGGLTSSAYGGLNIGISATRPEKLEFNTIVANPISGIDCAKVIVAPNNIIAGNGLLLSDNSVGCETTDSLVTDNLVPLAFESIDPPYDYHIKEASTAKDNAPVQSAIVDDYDGDIRPQDVAKDYGADEYRAP